MSSSMILDSGTGESKGEAGVKTAKLCMVQDQIGKPAFWSYKKQMWPALSFRVRSLEVVGNCNPRGMIVACGFEESHRTQNPAYSKQTLDYEA